jgi:hypothetical protein
MVANMYRLGQACTSRPIAIHASGSWAVDAHTTLYQCPKFIQAHTISQEQRHGVLYRAAERFYGLG